MRNKRAVWIVQIGHRAPALLTYLIRICRLIFPEALHFTSPWLGTSHAQGPILCSEVGERLGLNKIHLACRFRTFCNIHPRPLVHAHNSLWERPGLLMGHSAPVRF